MQPIRNATDKSKAWLNNALFSEKKTPIIKNEILLGKELYDTKKKLSNLEARLAEIDLFTRVIKGLSNIKAKQYP